MLPPTGTPDPPYKRTLPPKGQRRRRLAGPRWLSTLWKRIWDKEQPATRRVLYASGGAAGLSSLGFGMLLLYLLVLVPFTPSKDRIRSAATQRASVIVDAEGGELVRFDHAHRVWVEMDRISPHVTNALIATEDHRFYSHNGIDYRRLAGSVAYTMLGDTQGGSTITMQLARNLYPDRIGKAFGPNRKCKELVTARKIESVFEKDEIVELYLNSVPFLYGVRGIEMAAQTYFRKPARNLNLEESAVLVGMLKATSYYNPVRNPERARGRRDVVIRQMLKHGLVDSTAAAAAISAPVRVNLKRPSRPGARAPHFVDRVERRARDWARRNGYDLFSDGLVIRTPLDPDLQRAAETAIRRQGDALQRVANVEWSRRSGTVRSTNIRDYAALDRSSRAFEYFWASKPELVDQFVRESAAYRDGLEAGASAEEALASVKSNAQAMRAIRTTKSRLEAGFVALDPRTGEIRAWVGSRDYVKAPFDHVASARRQPGSTFKPIVYAAALEAGFRPDQYVPNRNVEIDVKGSGVWRLASARDADSHITLREALANSHNNVAAHLMQEVGTRKTAAVAKRLGVKSSPLAQVPSLALGTSPVSLLEMATVYATIAGGGMYREPVLITQILDRSGNVVHEPKHRPKRVLTEASAIGLTDMLRDVVDEGTGRRIRYQFGVRADVGGKTGTTQNNMDGWFLAVHPHLVLGSWVGFDDPRVTFRSDFWGEGAHNALFVVGDVLRQSSARGKLDSRVRFTDPPRPDRRYRFADSSPSWLERQLERLERSRADRRRERSRRDDQSRSRAPEIRREWLADDNDDDRRQALAERLQEYERLKQRIASGIRIDERLREAYEHERATNPELRRLERELDVRIRRWVREAEQRLAEAEGG